MRIQDGTPPERLRRIIGRCILFQRMFIDKDRENALSLAKSAYNREIGRPTKTCAPCASATATGSSPTPRCSMRRRSALERHERDVRAL